jgi:hypothetical protein
MPSHKKKTIGIGAKAWLKNLLHHVWKCLLRLGNGQEAHIKGRPTKRRDMTIYL